MAQPPPIHHGAPTSFSSVATANGASKPFTTTRCHASAGRVDGPARTRLDSILMNQVRIAEPAAGKSTFPTTGAVHFSTRGEYGVRLMVELARHYGTGPVSLHEMADHEALPRPYLEQLVVSLRAAGLVKSTRGAHGGYELGADPAEIRMGAVVRALEGPIAPMVCASEDPAHAGLCGRTGFCNVNTLWTRVRDAVVVALDSMTLADLARPTLSHPFHPIDPASLRTPRDKEPRATA